MPGSGLHLRAGARIIGEGVLVAGPTRTDQPSGARADAARRGSRVDEHIFGLALDHVHQRVELLDAGLQLRGRLLEPVGEAAHGLMKAFHIGADRGGDELDVGRNGAAPIQ